MLDPLLGPWKGQTSVWWMVGVSVRPMAAPWVGVTGSVVRRIKVSSPKFLVKSYPAEAFLLSRHRIILGVMRVRKTEQ